MYPRLSKGTYLVYTVLGTWVSWNLVTSMNTEILRGLWKW